MASLPNPLACVSIDLFGDQLNQDQICSLRCCVCLQLPARPLYCITCKCPIGAACYDALQANDNTIDECPTCRTIDDYATATVPPGKALPDIVPLECKFNCGDTFTLEYAYIKADHEANCERAYQRM